MFILVGSSLTQLFVRSTQLETDREARELQTKIADLVQIPPSQFEGNNHNVIEYLINAKYSNRVIQKIGLCICMYDLLWASEGRISHGDGNANVNVEFRLIVFRPFKGESLFGMISSSTPEGLHIRTEFFDEIFVSYKELPEKTEFDHNQQSWIWVVDDEEPSSRMYYDKNEVVRFQVIDETWHDQIPDSADPDIINAVKKTSPYSLQGSMMKEGLGICLWWD